MLATDLEQQRALRIREPARPTTVGARRRPQRLQSTAPVRVIPADLTGSPRLRSCSTMSPPVESACFGASSGFAVVLPAVGARPPRSSFFVQPTISRHEIHTSWLAMTRERIPGRSPARNVRSRASPNGGHSTSRDDATREIDTDGRSTRRWASGRRRSAQGVRGHPMTAS